VQSHVLQLDRDTNGVVRCHGAKDIRVQNASEDLSTIDHAWARAAKIRCGVDSPYLIVAYRRQIEPSLRESRLRQCLHDLMLIVTARDQYNHFRSVGADRCPGRRNRTLTGVPQAGVATSQRDLFGHPVTRSERGFKPFKEQCPRTPPDAFPRIIEGPDASGETVYHDIRAFPTTG